MRRRGKLGGQNKVPRMDNTGSLTCDLVQFLRETDRVGIEVSPIPSESMFATNVPTGSAGR